MSDWKSPHPLICSAVLLAFIVFKLSKCESADEAYCSDICWLTRAQTVVADCLTIDGSISSSRISRVTSAMIASSSCLLCFMMFLQIAADLFSKACSGTMQRNCDNHLRR